MNSASVTSGASVLLGILSHLCFFFRSGWGDSGLQVCARLCVLKHFICLLTGQILWDSVQLRRWTRWRENLQLPLGKISCGHKEPWRKKLSHLLPGEKQTLGISAQLSSGEDRGKTSSGGIQIKERPISVMFTAWTLWTRNKTAWLCCNGASRHILPLFLGLEGIQLDQLDRAVCSVMKAQHSFVVYL